MPEYWNTTDPTTGETLAALYIYSSYSPFESAVNRYMSSGLPVTPGVAQGQQSDLNNTSFESLTNDTQHAQQLPVGFTVPHDITLLDSQ